MIDWIKKVAGYAPDIAAAVATGGSSLAVTGLRILGKELLGTETASESDIEKAVLSASPEQMVKLQISNNEFKAEIKRLENEAARDKQVDLQAEHSTTQETIKNGDNSDSAFVRFTRPGQSWVCLAMAGWFAHTDKPIEVILMFLGVTTTYMGMRQLGKWKSADSLTKLAIGKNK